MLVILDLMFLGRDVSVILIGMLGEQPIKGAKTGATEHARVADALGQAAGRLNVDPSRIRQLVRDKVLEFERDSRGGLLVDAAQVDAYAAARRKYVKKGKL